MSITSLFYVGLEYNVYYTRFPREVVLCRGRIDRIEKEWVDYEAELLAKEEERKRLKKEKIEKSRTRGLLGWI